MEYTYISDLAAHVAELLKVGHPTEHVQGRSVFANDQIKVLAFPFKAGQSLEEHTAPYTAILHFLEGEAEVTIGDNVHQAHAGTWVHMPANLVHSIHARTPVVMMLVTLPTDS